MASNYLDHIVDCANRCTCIIVGELSDYWIIKTDYSNFAVVYICYDENTDGTCGNAKAWVYSRHHGLAHDLMADADRQLERVCMDTTLFYTTQRIQSKSLTYPNLLRSNARFNRGGRDGKGGGVSRKGVFIARFS